MMNAAAMAIDYAAVPISLTRREDGTYNSSGDFVEGVATTSSIKAVKQPTVGGSMQSGRQLYDLPEGIREEARWTLWSRAELRLDDAVSWAGQSFRILYVWPREEGGFYRAVAGLLK